MAYERKGQDDLAMADYNLALQKRPNFGNAYNNRGTLYLRKRRVAKRARRFQSRRSNIRPNMFCRPYQPRPRARR